MLCSGAMRSHDPLARLSRRLEQTPDRLVAAVLVVASLLLACGFVVPRQWTRGLLINDEYWHAHLARNVYDGEGYVADSIAPMHAPTSETLPAAEAWKQPLYPVLVAWAWNVTGVDVRTMLAISMMAFAAGIGLTYTLGRRLGLAKSTAAVAAGIVAAAPVSLSEHITANPESLYFALFLTSVLLALRTTPAAALLAGATHGALLLVKGHAVLYLPVFALFLALGGPQVETAGREREQRPDLRSGLRLLLPYGAGLVVAMVLASLVLPAGAQQLFRAGNTYSLGFLLATDLYPGSELPYSEVHPPDAWAYILSHPLDYGEKVLRMVSRTKYNLDGMGLPALTGLLFPLLWTAIGMILLDRLFGLAILDHGGTPDRQRDSQKRRWPDLRSADVFLVALLLVTFGFFWTWRLTERYVLHLFPIMIFTIFRAGGVLRPAYRSLQRPLRRGLVVAAVAWFCLYPATYSLWEAYRVPYSFLGRTLAGRYLDYDAVTANIERWVPPDGVVVSDLNHEIAWLAQRRTVAFPLSQEDLSYLVDRYDADAVYEHPLLDRDWAYLRREFVLMDAANGRLWVRRRHVQNTDAAPTPDPEPPR